MKEQESGIGDWGSGITEQGAGFGDLGVSRLPGEVGFRPVFAVNHRISTVFTRSKRRDGNPG